MDSSQNWPHRWFGCWRGDHSSLQHFPIMQEFTDKEWQCPNRQDVLHYLRHSPALLFMFPGSWRTDGVWLWPDAVAEEIEHDYVRLPDAFLTYIAGRDFMPLPYLETSIETILADLDWPFTPFPPLLRAADKARVRKIYPTLEEYRPRRKGISDYLMTPVGELLRGKRS